MSPLSRKKVYGGECKGNRSGCENLTLAITSPHGVPCRHGNTACIITRGVGTDPIRGASLYSSAGSACGDLGVHGPRLPGAGPYVTRAAEPDLTELLPSAVERSTLSRTSISASEYATPWWSTGASWLDPPPHPCGRRRCGGGLKARAVSARPRALSGGGPQAVASSRDREAPEQAGGHRVSMASARVRGVWRADPRPVAQLTITHNFRALREQPKGQVGDNKKGAADNTL
jgi:hypothetical protein